MAAAIIHQRIMFALTAEVSLVGVLVTLLMVIVTFVELNFVKYLGIALIVETAGILYIVLTQVITSNVN